MKIAIIGTGIAGNVAAYKLRQNHDITVFESGNYVGGHTNTVDVYEDDRPIAVDTGFIVFNDRTYPKFIQLLEEIGQDSQPSEMSFSVRAERGDIEYSGSSLNSLFAQRRNIIRRPFLRMIRDILRFNKSALPNIDQQDESEPLKQYLFKNGYSHEFVDHYLVPMAAAIWSAEPGSVLDMPVGFLVRFFANHGLLQVKDRPVWRVIKGGHVHDPALILGAGPVHTSRSSYPDTATEFASTVRCSPFVVLATVSRFTLHPAEKSTSIMCSSPVTVIRRYR